MTVHNIKGRIASIGELKTGSNKGRDYTLINFSVAHNPVWYDDTKKEWVSGETTFENCVAFYRLAENISEKLKVGYPVIGTAKRVSKAPFTTNKGNEIGVTYEYHVDELGIDISLNLPGEGKNNARSGGQSVSRSENTQNSGSENTLKSRGKVFDSTPAYDEETPF